jgi:hypothetical protein
MLFLFPVNVVLNIAHKLIQNIEPAIATFKAPTHTSFFHVLVTVDHHFWIPLAQQLI